jgi:hypothetical protein
LAFPIELGLSTQFRLYLQLLPNFRQSSIFIRVF